MKTVGEVPFDCLEIGDRIISCTGKKGWIGGLYPVGTVDPIGNDWDDWGGGILCLWFGYESHPTFSIAGWSGLKVKYEGGLDD